jgi:nucleotide-binding universal stress UspA family protein
MTGRIVVGIDGSPQSANALEWAITRARLGGQQLDLVSAYSLTPALDFYGYTLGAQPIDWYAEHAEQLLAAAESRVQEAAAELTCTRTSESGDPALTLARAAEGADAVVVGRRGLGVAAGALVGSVSNRLTVHATCPVVVVGAGELPETGSIVVGVDGSEYAVNALRYALVEAAARGTSVRVVTAYDTLHPAFRIDAGLVAQLRADAEAEARETLSQAVAAAQGSGVASVDVDQVAVEGRAAEAILDHAADAQLVVVGAHGKGLVRRILLGSVSRQVLTDADRPVAVVNLPEG